MAQVLTQIESEPAGARVVVDAVFVGLSPVTNLPLNPGNHQIELSLEGYVPVHYEVDLQPAKSVVFHFRLKQLHTIVFKTKEEGLAFLLDGRYRWQEPKMRFQMAEGVHTLQVFEADSLVDEQTFEIGGSVVIKYKIQSVIE
jgi:hypothetical protein